MNYQFSKKAFKQFKKLPKNLQTQIIKKIDFYFKVSNPLKFAKRLTDHELGEYRFRVGDYRLTFDVKHDAAIFLKVDHRKDVYKR